MPQKIRDLTGQQFGCWLVLRHEGRGKGKDQRWLCRCDCGTERVVSGRSLKIGSSTNCGCQRRKPLEPGMRFFWLITLREGPKYRSMPQWWCRCDCGNEVLVRAQNLRDYNTTSCGCYFKQVVEGNEFGKTHGGRNTRTYSIWRCMIRRCEDNVRYIKRRITVCARWRNDFAAFREDMGEAPPGKTIDRKDGRKGYEPGNCRWATYDEQANNRLDNVTITYRGKTRTVAQWSRRTGVKDATIRQRLKAGWSPGQCLGFAKHPTRKGLT